MLHLMASYKTVEPGVPPPEMWSIFSVTSAKPNPSQCHQAKVSKPEDWMITKVAKLHSTPLIQSISKMQNQNRFSAD